MGDTLTVAMYNVIRAVSFLLTSVSYIPWYILTIEKRRKATAIRGQPVDTTRPEGPWRAVESMDSLSEEVYPGCDTVVKQFEHAVSLFGDFPCLGSREIFSEEDEKQPNGRVFKKLIMGEYNWDTFNEVQRKAESIGSALHALGVDSKSHIVIFAETRAEWLTTMFGCMKYGYPVVTLYATLGDEAIVHGIQESDGTVLFTSAELMKKVQNIAPKLTNVNHVVYYKGLVSVDTKNFPENISVHKYSDVLDLGAKNLCEPSTQPKADDLAVVMYTSGSTGLPKGVMISHRNIVAAQAGQIDRVANLGTRDTYIGYLPLAHILELCCEIGVISFGAKIGYSSTLTITDQSSKIKKGSKGDCSVLNPTLMATVPVIMDRIYKVVIDKVSESGPFGRALFEYAYSYKLRHMKRGWNTPFFNWLVFNRVRSILGGNVRMLLSGGAPISRDTQRFMNVCMCCPVLQGYGLTETTGCGTLVDVHDITTGRTGAPKSCLEIKLVDFLEGGYTSQDKPSPRGEIAVGGAPVTLGYYKNPEKTTETFFTDKKGVRWFLTGDIGEIHEDGCIEIIDRKKDLVKLQTGEYICLGRVEALLKTHPLVDSIWMFADSLENYAICFIVPNPKQLKNIAAASDITEQSNEELCSNQTVVSIVLKTLQAHATKVNIGKFEVPQKLALCPEQWTPDSGLVTDAFKLKRYALTKNFQSEIKRLYGKKN